MENNGLVMGLMCAFPFVWAAVWFALGRWSKTVRITRVDRYARVDDPLPPAASRPATVRRIGGEATDPTLGRGGK